MIGLSNASKLYSNSAFLYKMIGMVAAIIFLLGAAIGAPYGQTWYGRWNG